MNLEEIKWYGTHLLMKVSSYMAMKGINKIGYDELREIIELVEEAKSKEEAKA